MSQPDRLTWEEKLAALKCLCETHLEMRKPGEWYVYASDRSIAGDGVLTYLHGEGSCPRLAVESDFDLMAEVMHPKYIVAKRCGKTRRVRWGGFMWIDIPESE